METFAASPHLALTRDMIDVAEVPFTDRGSRLLLYRTRGANRLEIRLAERLNVLEAGLETYRTRAPFVRDIALLGPDGEPLPFELTTYPHALFLHTALGDFGVAFHDERTLAFGLPPGAAGLRFTVFPQYIHATGSGGLFRPVRSLAYATNAAITHNTIEPAGQGYTVDLRVDAGQDSAISMAIGPEPDLTTEARPFSATCAAAAARWQRWFEQAPPVLERYRRAYAYAWWVMAANLVTPRGCIRYEAMMPSKIHYVGLWLWDSALHALAYRHVNPTLAREQLLAMLAWQQPDGMLPDAVHDEGIVTAIGHPLPAAVTKPPILAWAALKIHQLAPDTSFLAEIYPALWRCHSWWLMLNDDDGDGLAQYNHPYSSGLDDNPLWDTGMPVESPDLNTYLYLQSEALGQMAGLLGRAAEAAMWLRRRDALLRRMLADLWDAEAGVFQALHNEQPVPVLTPVALLPLWTGALPTVIRDRLVAHLTDPAEFWGDSLLPTVARNDPKFDPERMWRGPAWANMNYFLIEGLERSGLDRLAAELRTKTLDMIAAQPGMYEYYNPITGAPPASAARMFGWTAALFIDMAISATRAEACRTSS